MKTEKDAVPKPERKRAKRVFCGSVAMGGGAPVSIQSMTNVDTRDIAAATGQIVRLAAAGCDIVRCAVPDMAAAEALAGIRTELAAREVGTPIVADIHFDHRLAIAAIESGADKIRINPGNIGGDDRVRAVVKRAADAGVPIRIGVNGGSLEKDILQAHGGPTAAALSESAMRNVDRVASMGFDDIVASVKSSDVRVGLEALRMLSAKTDFPLHLGVTEAGAGDRALVKSAIGIGALLADGIGDTVRVSLTGDPVIEVRVAYDILASVGMLPEAINVVSCPTCGRCKVDLPHVAEEVRRAVSAIETGRIALARRELFARLAEGRGGNTADNSNNNSSSNSNNIVVESVGREVHDGSLSGYEPFTVAVMGCAVNGPGEASHADVGVACGDGSAVLFADGAKVGTASAAEIVPALIELIRSGLRGRKDAHWKT